MHACVFICIYVCLWAHRNGFSFVLYYFWFVVLSVFFLLIIKHHKFLIELRNIHTGASKLDSIHIHWFALFPSGFHSFGCNSIGSLLFELIKKKSLSHTMWAHSTRPVSNENARNIFNSSKQFHVFRMAILSENVLNWKKTKNVQKAIRMRWINSKKKELDWNYEIGFVFFNFWMAIFRLSG